MGVTAPRLLRLRALALVAMAAGTGAATAADSDFPSRTFPFVADFGGGLGGEFSNVSGLRALVEPAPAGEGRAAPPVVLTRGIVDEKTGDFLVRWLASPRGSQRRTIVVTLRDAAGRTRDTWTVRGAWIARMSSDEAETGEGRKVDTLVLKHD